MNRRSFVKLLGITPAVAPSVGAAVLNEPSIVGAAGALKAVSSEKDELDFDVAKPVRPKFHLRKFLKELDDDPRKRDMRVLHREAAVHFPLSGNGASVDVDIRAMRSLSHVGKIFAQRRRYVESRLEGRLERNAIRNLVERELGFTLDEILYGDAEDDFL